MSVSPARYSAVAIVLHWLIAALILTNIGLAWWFDTLPRIEQVAPTQLHKSIGITVLILTLVRIAWRFVRRPPPMAPVGAPWERRLAQAVHVLLYALMLGLPLTGWAMVSASRLIHAFPVTLYGLVQWPTIDYLASLPQPQMRQAHEVFEFSHHLLAKAAYGLIVLHVGAALMHQFVRRDGVLARMVPFIGARAA
ncbi:MAG TPA: cytochrome b [Caulobacteraceae bacterium]|nr:cytochrome b [Caulobacteraceae bacterium]